MAIETQFRPTTEEVAAFIKNRTDDGNNNFLGDFDYDTVVTADEVNLLIDQTGELVLAALRWDPLLQAVSIPESNWPAVKSSGGFVRSHQRRSDKV
jgi:hypothetical protein